MMAGLDIEVEGEDWKEIGVWHLPAPHLPERLLLIAYPHLSRDKNELEREEESSLSQFSQPRGAISGMCCTLTPGWLHSLDVSLISWMRRDEEEGENNVWLRERGSRSKSVWNNLPPFKRVRQFEVIFSWHLNTYYSHTSVRAAVAKLNDLANRREFNLTSPSQNGNN